MNLQEKLERGAELILLEDLDGADDDDDVRSVAFLQSLVDDILEYRDQLELADGTSPDDALIILRSMIDRRLTVGDLRRYARRALGDIAAEA